MPRLPALAAVLLFAAAPAWGGGAISVVTTTTDLKALVEAVGGDRVSVESLAPAIHDPHAVEVKPGQLARLREAALLVRIGLDHEPWLARPLQTAGNPRLLPRGPGDLDVSSGIELLQAETVRARPERGGHVHGVGNTHYWLDPENARVMTATLDNRAGQVTTRNLKQPHLVALRGLEQVTAEPEFGLPEPIFRASA